MTENDSTSDYVTNPGASRTVEPTIANHEILALIDQGSSSKIWQATNLLLNHEVAIKTPLLSPFERSSDRRTAFLAEASMARVLQHPNVVRVFDVGLTDQGQPFFSMALASRRLHPQVSTSDKLLAITAIAEALEYLHQQGIVHCDVKPSNVLDVGSPSKPHWVLADLGLAWKLQDPVIVGTGSFGFVAPERFTATAPTPSSDVYSFARLVQSLLLPALEPIGKGGALGALLNSSLSPDPADRRTSPADLAQALLELSQTVEAISAEVDLQPAS